jgi:glycosyltransferase involved in cell wall biosynthesis
MYSLASPDDVQVTLVHQNPQQPRVDLFQAQHELRGGNGLLATVRFLRQSQRWLRQHAADYDVLHGLSGYHLTMQPAFQAHQLGLPAVVFMTSHGVELVDKPGLRGMLGWPRKRRQMAKHIEGLVAMSTAVYDELLSFGIDQRRIARIPMGVNTNRFRPVASPQARTELRQSLGLLDCPTLLFVGAIIRRKRPHLLVQSLADVRRQGHECQLVLVGPSSEPEYHDEIKQLINDLGIQEYVRHVNFTEQVELYHQAADLFALPSRIEGMPAAMVEAMACGLACLGTAISGISDLIESGTNGFLVEPTVESISEAWANYLKHPPLMAEHGAKSRERVMVSYDATSVLNAYLKLFRCVTSGQDAAEASILPARR